MANETERLAELVKKWKAEYPPYDHMDSWYKIHGIVMRKCANELQQVLDARPPVAASLEEAADSAAEEIVESSDVGVTVYDIILKHITPVVAAMQQAAAVEMRERISDYIHNFSPDVNKGFLTAGDISKIPTPVDALDRMLRECAAQARERVLPMLSDELAESLRSDIRAGKGQVNEY